MSGISNSIRFGGLASGLDTQALIDALVQVERVPILRLQAQRQRLNQQDAIFGKIDGKLDALRRAVEALDTTSEFGSFAAVSSNENALTATASGSATAGTYNISVTSIAQAESRRTGGFASNTADAGTGTIRLTVNGTNHDIALTNPTNSLEAVRDAINSSSAPVTATLINDGGASNPWKLVLSSDETGTANAVSVDLTNFTAADPAFNFGTQLQGAVDAVFTVNGQQITRASNTVTDAVNGLTLKLKSGGTGVSSTVTVTTDTAGIRKKVEDLIKAYNDIVADVAPQNVVGSDGQTSAVLFGDSGLRGVTNRLRTALNHEVSGTNSAYTSLASVGVRTGSDGKLSLDATRFDAAVAADLNGVSSLFTKSATLLADSGAARQLKAAVDDLTDPTDGVIKARRDGIQRRIRTIDERVSDLEDRLGGFEERLVNRFAMLEQIMSSLQAQGASLSSFAS